MPLLFCLDSALSAVVAGLREGERLFANLDDLHASKTKVWDKKGTYPPDCAKLQCEATDVSPEAVVWRGDAHLHFDQQLHG